MARTKLPDPLARRHLLEAALEPARAKALAEGYLARGREIEAIDFLAKAGDESSLVALENEAVQRGDVFLLRRVAQALGREPGPERWRALADAANRAGRQRDAEAAIRLAAVDV